MKTVQEQFSEAIKNSDKIGKIMSLSDQKALFRRNSSVAASRQAAKAATAVKAPIVGELKEQPRN